MNDRYDCIVIGGGPAGSTAAALVAQAGPSVLLLEREAMPRFHVGESLMPESYWTLQRLGMLDAMRQSDFVPKQSVQFVNASGKLSAPFFFKEHDPRECSQTWQVERAKFDQMLFDNAAAKGADCVDGARVVEVLFDGQRACGVRVQLDGQSREIAATVVVDASGQAALLGNRLGLLREDPELRKAAVWTYYRGAVRDSGDNGGATIILHVNDRQAWFWFIPLARDVTSIGVVGDHQYMLKQRGSPEEVFCQELAKCEAMQQRLAAAQRVDKFRVAREFSYVASQPAGNGWVLVGDAMGFIDPIYSSGVFFALKSGEMAADCIIEALRDGDVSAERLGRWAADFAGSTRWVRKLVDAFYTDRFSFGRFLKDHPHHRGGLTDLLIGRIFHNEAGEIFDAMDGYVEAAREG